MSSIRTADLHRIFDLLDKNGDGLVSLEELLWLLDSIGVQTSREELKLLVGKHNLDPIDFVLFHDLVIIKGNNDIDDNNNVGESRPSTSDDDDDRRRRLIGEKDLRKAFEVFDSNGDGFISEDELERVLCRLGLWDDERYDNCASVIDVYDTNRDGKIDFEEFKNMMLL